MNIKDFVYSYVLDEKEVNIDILRENVRSYQDLERTLAGVKARLVKLEEIQKKFVEVMTCVKWDQQYEYYMGQSELDIFVQEQKEIQEYISKEQYDMEDLLVKVPENSQIWIQEYRRLMEQYSPVQVKENYGRRKKANETNRFKAENTMKEEMVSYKMSYDFGASATLEGYWSF